MKRLFLQNSSQALSVAAAVLTGCTTGTEETLQYVNLSQVSCSFLGEGNQPLVIEVKASPGHVGSHSRGNVGKGGAHGRPDAHRDRR